MITLITGAPGSGKTLYVVSKLLMPLQGTFVEATDDEGNKVQHPRTIYTNINGLMLPHEKIDAEWLLDWRNRVKPGAIIVPDEAQKMWPKRVTGSKVPQSVQDLETHRHDGVDFIPITQKPELVDQNVTSLAGRHLHVRRVGNSHNAIVYEWDSCSRGLLYKNAFKKSAFRYPRKAFEWYKSAEAHTKMPRALPTALFVALFAAAGAAVAWPVLMDKITSGLDGKPKAAQTVKASPTPSLLLPEQLQQPAGAGGAVFPAQSQAAAPAQYLGCAARAGVCRCYGQDGLPVELELEVCQAKLEAPVPLLSGTELGKIFPEAVEVRPPADLQRDAEQARVDGAALSFMRQ